MKINKEILPPDSSRDGAMLPIWVLELEEGDEQMMISNRQHWITDLENDIRFHLFIGGTTSSCWSWSHGAGAYILQFDDFQKPPYKTYPERLVALGDLELKSSTGQVIGMVRFAASQEVLAA